MATDTLVLVEHAGLSKTRKTSIEDNTPAEAGYIPLLDNNGRLNNKLLNDTLLTSRSLRWDEGSNTLVISNGSENKGPDGEIFSDNKNPEIRWTNGYPVLFGYKNGKTVGVRVDTCRNSDTVAELEVATAQNSQPNRIVRTDANGYIQNDYIYLNGNAEIISSDLKNFLYINASDNRIRKSTIDETQKVLNLDYYSYVLDLTSLSSLSAYPVTFNQRTCAFLITLDGNSSFNAKVEAVTCTSENDSAMTILKVNHTKQNYIHRLINTGNSKSLIMYLRGGSKYRVYNIDRNKNCKGSISSTGIATSSFLKSNDWYMIGDADITSSTPETYIRTTHTVFNCTGWGNNNNYDGSSYNIARADHNHRVDVNNDKIQMQSSNENMILYGKSRSLYFRTDGKAPQYGRLGNYPFVWLYGGDDTSNRIMYLTDNGDLYPTRCYNAVYADLAECFKPEDRYAGNMYKDYVNRIVEITDDEHICIAKEESERCIGIISDTYGFMLNGTQDEIDAGTKVPIAMAGTVYVDAENKSEGKIGDMVCSGKEGKARVTTNRQISIGKIIGFKENKYKIIVAL